MQCEVSSALNVIKDHKAKSSFIFHWNSMGEKRIRDLVSFYRLSAPSFVRYFDYGPLITFVRFYSNLISACSVDMELEWRREKNEKYFWTAAKKLKPTENHHLHFMCFLPFLLVSPLRLRFILIRLFHLLLLLCIILSILLCTIFIRYGVLIDAIYFYERCRDGLLRWPHVIKIQVSLKWWKETATQSDIELHKSNAAWKQLSLNYFK